MSQLSYHNENSNSLTQEDLRKLESSWITPQLAQEAGLFRVSTNEGAEIVGRKAREDYSGIAFPYYWPGKPYPRAYRLRRDNPDLEIKADGTIKESGKYMSEPGRPNRLYFTPGHQEDELKNINIAIVFTEGEKKALGLEQFQREKKLNLLPIGLTGVYGFRGKIGKVDSPNGTKKDVKGNIADLDSIAFTGRKVYICYDTNVWENESVRIAERQFAKVLRSLAANVTIVRIPKELKDQGINGIDDVLGKFGADYVEKLFLDAEKNNVEDHEAIERKLDDLDFAFLFADNHPDLRYDETAKTWRKWTQTHWEHFFRSEKLKSLVTEVIRSVSPDTSITKNKVNSVIDLAKATCLKDFDSANEHLINFTNGTLDYFTREFYPHEQDDLLCKVFPYPYDPSATAENYPNIKHYLLRVFPDKASIYSLMTHAGLAIIGDRKMHNLPILIGEPGSGKSTALALINMVCGCGLEEAFNFAGTSLFDRGLEGKRSRAIWNQHKLVAIDELPIEAFRNEELLKAMSAHSGVEMRLIGKDELVGNRWQSKLMFATNLKPKLVDMSGALRRRLIFLEVPHKLADKEIDRNLLNSFLLELGAFAKACLEMAAATIKLGNYPVSNKMKKFFEEVRDLSNPLKQWVDDNCVLDKSAWSSSSQLYGSYKTYCEENGLDLPKSHIFTSNLTNLLQSAVTTGKKHDNRGIHGIRFRPKDEVINAETETEADLKIFINIFTGVKDL